MKNKGVLLLSMIILLLSFFVFQGTSSLTGMVFKDGEVVPSFLEEEEEIDRYPEMTTVHTDRFKITRGKKLPLKIYPGEMGVFSEVEIRDMYGDLERYVYLCSAKVCTRPRSFPVYFSRTAMLRGDYTLVFFDVKTQSPVKLKINVV